MGRMYGKMRRADCFETEAEKGRASGRQARRVAQAKSTKQTNPSTSQKKRRSERGGATTEQSMQSTKAHTGD